MDLQRCLSLIVLVKIAKASLVITALYTGDARTCQPWQYRQLGKTPPASSAAWSLCPALHWTVDSPMPSSCWSLLRLPGPLGGRWAGDLLHTSPLLECQLNRHSDGWGCSRWPRDAHRRLCGKFGICDITQHAAIASGRSGLS